MRIEMITEQKQNDVYLTSLYNNEPGIYIGTNDHIWIVGRDRKINGYFSSTIKDFCPLDNSWADYNFACEKIRRYDGRLVLRNAT